MTRNQALVLIALRESAEGEHGDWRDVYLDNAHAKVSQFSANQFRSQLASLSKAGFYKIVDSYAWGSVKTAG